MWKIALGFIVFAALALYLLSKGPAIDMGGEQHGTESTQATTAAKPTSNTAAPLPAAAASKP